MVKRTSDPSCRPPGGASHPTRSRIQQAALDCFSRHGLADTTVAQIAEQAGVSPAALYQHFAGKQHLFDSLERPDLDRPPTRPEQRRRQIVLAAQRVFAQRGMAEATLDEVAAAVGMTRAALYRYFPCKEALFSAVLATLPLDDALDALWGGQEVGTEPEPLLIQMALGFLRFHRDPTQLALLRILLSESVRDPQVAAQFHGRLRLRGGQLLAAHLERLGYGPPEELVPCAQAFAGMLFTWLLFHRVFDQEPVDLAAEQEVAARAVRLLLHGIGPRRIDTESVVAHEAAPAHLRTTCDPVPSADDGEE